MGVLQGAIAGCDQVLHSRLRVGQRANEPAHHLHLAPLNGPKGSTVPLHFGSDVRWRLIGTMFVEHPLQMCSLTIWYSIGPPCRYHMIAPFDDEPGTQLVSVSCLIASVHA
jgi:hypothetical protein